MNQIINVNMFDMQFGLKPELHLMRSHKRSVVDTVSEEHTISDELKHFKVKESGFVWGFFSFCFW